MITVCLTTYNSHRFLHQQIQSILPQLSTEDEILISDDGSTDDTLAIIQGFESPLIRVIHNEGEHGYTPNFENALRMAKGDIIFLADHDDIWMPNKVERCLALLEDADFVVHDATIIDEWGNLKGNSFYFIRHPRRTLLGNIVKIGFLGCCMAFRRNLLEKALPFPSNHTLCTHDNWLTLIGMAYFRCKVSDECLVAYRRHAANVSSGEQNTHRAIGFRLKYRFYLLVNLIMRWSR